LQPPRKKCASCLENYSLSNVRDGMRLDGRGRPLDVRLESGGRATDDPTAKEHLGDVRGAYDDYKKSINPDFEPAKSSSRVSRSLLKSN
jgi:hypothetical protein